jgi:hypothetical protein
VPLAVFVSIIPPRALLQTKESHVAKDDIEPDDLEEEIDLEGEDDLDIIDDDIDDDVLVDDDGDDDDDDDSLGATVVRKATSSDDDDDDDDMVAPDDVEEDLAAILKDRLTAEELPDEEDEVVEVDDRTGSDETLQPKRADEVLCTSCFMLVRQNAPVCPMGDDACPIVKK